MTNRRGVGINEGELENSSKLNKHGVGDWNKRRGKKILKNVIAECGYGGGRNFI